MAEERFVYLNLIEPDFKKRLAQNLRPEFLFECSLKTRLGEGCYICFFNGVDFRSRGFTPAEVKIQKFLFRCSSN